MRENLGAFAKLRKATVSFVMSLSVCLSILVKQLGTHLTKFHAVLYLTISRKSVKNIQVALKSDKTNGYFT